MIKHPTNQEKTVPDLRDRILQITTEVGQEVVGRNDLIRSALRAMIAEQHVMLIGPPGNAKTMMFERILARIEGANIFSTLVTPYTTEDAILGPPSIKALKEEDVIRRNSSGMLPGADYALMDEIWKMAETLSASLLSILNERRFPNGGEKMQDVPLRSMVAASNELPYGQGFDAAVDRIAVRFLIDAPSADDTDLIMAILNSSLQPTNTTVSLDEMTKIGEEAGAIPLSEDFKEWLVHEFRPALCKADESFETAISIRRLKQGIEVAKVEAWMCGADAVMQEHGVVFKDVCWNEPYQIGEVHQLVGRMCARQGQTIDGNTLSDELKAIVDQHTTDMMNAGAIGDTMGSLASIENKTTMAKSKLNDIQVDWHNRYKNDPNYSVKIEQFTIAGQIIAETAKDALVQMRGGF